ncbi:uncharacterized protein EI97DRAFT_445097 [Westerdykella ornata]|uniref:Uncharacterized protein n=1 Tax=Westerdykella ornata TaxID=318751 RepID=A0A6A6J9B8_WESOR|nr:uncharacterized protein EI97DRAFT_445097 [Westerdykella ornata]KAF2273170.1 hypothetical protein EI97DRAFT_445097 [Westerdykella ornata]
MKTGGKEMQEEIETVTGMNQKEIAKMDSMMTDGMHDEKMEKKTDKKRHESRRKRKRKKLRDGGNRTRKRKKEAVGQNTILTSALKNANGVDLQTLLIRKRTVTPILHEKLAMISERTGPMRRFPSNTTMCQRKSPCANHGNWAAKQRPWPLQSMGDTIAIRSDPTSFNSCQCPSQETPPVSVCQMGILFKIATDARDEISMAVIEEDRNLRPIPKLDSEAGLLHYCCPRLGQFDRRTVLYHRDSAVCAIMRDIDNCAATKLMSIEPLSPFVFAEAKSGPCASTSQARDWCMWYQRWDVMLRQSFKPPLCNRKRGIAYSIPVLDMSANLKPAVDIPFSSYKEATRFAEGSFAQQPPVYAIRAGGARYEKLCGMRLEVLPFPADRASMIPGVLRMLYEPEWRR